MFRWCFPPVAFSVVVAALTAAATSIHAQDAPRTTIAREHHSWARFVPGAWRISELIVETVDANGNVTNRSKTTRQATLAELGERGYSLTEQSTIITHGRRVAGPPQDSWHNLFLDDRSDVQDVELGASDNIVLNGELVPCRVLQIRLAGKKRPVVARIHYSSSESPFIFRRESYEAAADPTSTPLWQSTEEVIAINMPHCFRNQRFSSAHVRTTISTPKGSTVRMSVMADAVPGGILSQRSSELDRDGKVLRRSYLELVDYGYDQPERRPGRRRRADRRRR